MEYLVDTGVLLRLFDRSDPQHGVIRSLLRSLRVAGHTLFACPQNIAEFWNVSTRPASARGGFGHSVEVTERRVAFIERYGSILPDTPVTYAEWRKLVVDHQVCGVSVHDARLVAAMNANGISTIIALNTSDFARYRNIQALSPEAALDTLTSA